MTTHVAFLHPSFPTSSHPKSSLLLRGPPLRPLSIPMRKRKQLKPLAATRRSPAHKPTIVAHLDHLPRRPAVIGIAFLTAAAFVGILTLRARRADSNLVAFSSKSDKSHTQPLSHGNGADISMAPVFSAQVMAEYNHDPDAFTQGLAWHDGTLYESTGLQGRSSVRAVDLESGNVIQSHKLKYMDFGEGLSLLGPNAEYLLQVLWKVGMGYVYARDTLEPVSEFRFKGDAWGVASVPGTTDQLYLSDGTSQIHTYQLDGHDFKKVSSVTVHDGHNEVGLLNELEMVGDELWANVWMCDFVVRIDPHTGQVKSWVDLRDLLSKADIPPGHNVDVLNGIAWDASQGRVFVTGKLWPKLYSIRVTEDKVADKITRVANAFFLDSSRVRYVLNSVLA